MRPTVVFNALAVNPANAGSRTMFTRLVPALVEVAPHLRVVLLCHPSNRSLYPESVEAIVVGASVQRVWRRVLFDLFEASRVAARHGADVLVTPSNIGPVRAGLPHVAIVAAHLVLPSAQEAALPERMPWLKVQYFRWPFRRHLRRADHVLGISEHLAEGLHEELGLDADRTSAMPLGVTLPEAGPSLEGRDDTVLFVGTLYQYKGGETAIRAFARRRAELPPGARLVMVGKDHRDEAARLRRIVAELGVEDAVELRGPVSTEELERLFRTAGVLLMPSLCEGYGLPVAEAMAYGLPVIAADATSLPGVAGGAARLVAPGDVDGFGGALAEILNDAGLRREMAAAGVRRAHDLSWESAARALRDAIDATLAGAGVSAPARRARRSR
jgi:glycosyltransferase involved in cell wall biosynthesis